MKKPLLRKTASQKEEKTSVDAQPARDDQAFTLPVSSLIIKQNPRTNLGDIAELKDSIGDRGILNPLLVEKTADGWELLGGHRRLQCAKELGLTHVPCRVVKTDEPEVVKLLDNILRESLAPHDECLALKRLLPAFDGNKSALARALSKSPTYVTRAIKVADMIDADPLCAGAKLTKTALMELADASDPKAALAAATDGKKASIRQAREVADIGSPTRKPSGPMPGGRAVDRSIQFHERRGGSAFSLRINYDERAAPAAKEAIIKTLEDILLRLRRT